MKEIIPINPDKDPRLKAQNFPNIKGVKWMIDDFIDDDKIIICDEKILRERIRIDEVSLYKKMINLRDIKDF